MKRYFIPLFLTLSAGFAAAQPAPVGPVAIVVQQYTYAPVGVAPGTTLRMNVANLSSGTTVCTGNLSYINSDGTTIKNQAFTANAGETVSYPLLISDISGTPASAEVRGYVKIDRQFGGVASNGPAQPAGQTCTAVMSLEVVDIATGQTRAILTNPTAVSGLFVTPLPVVTAAPQ